MDLTRPEVLGITRTPDGVTLALHVPPTLECFPDHFPRLAMVPGVLQLDWAIGYAAEHLPVTGEFRGVSALKFQNAILPGARLELRLARGAGALAFAYAAADRTYSSGRVRFA